MIIGTVDVITFRTSRTDHPYLFPINALLFGLSAGHVALRFRFQDEEIAEKFLPKLSMIPQRKTADGYELYFSFWPHNESNIINERSKLVTHRHDSESSANYSPFDYKPAWQAYIQPPVKFCKSAIPFLSDLLWYKITLPPSIILHTHRLQNAHGVKVAKFAEIYAKLYTQWRKAVVLEQNAKLAYTEDQKILNRYRLFMLLAKFRMRIAEIILKKHVPDLENFITYGRPEEDRVTIPLFKNHFKHMLCFMHEVATNPKKYLYNVLSTNCAYISLRTLMHGFEEHFVFPDFLHKIKVTVTPTLLIQTAGETAEEIAAETAGGAVNSQDKVVYCPSPRTKCRPEGSHAKLDICKHV